MCLENKNRKKPKNFFLVERFVTAVFRSLDWALGAVVSVVPPQPALVLWSAVCSLVSDLAFVKFI